MNFLQSPDPSSKQNACSTIETLNDHCLIYIFNLLPIVDRIRAERVCKKWQEVSRDSWSKLKELILDPKYLGLIPYSNQFACTTKEIAEKILKRCGRYLEKINTRFEHVGFNCVYAVSEYCTNVQSTTFNSLTNRLIYSLSLNCTNITELNVNFMHEDHLDDLNRSLEQLFNNNKKIKVLNVCNFQTCTGECLLKLPLEQMQEIKIKDGICVQRNLAIAINFTEKLSSFQYRPVNKDIIEALQFNCINLTELCLTCGSNSEIADDSLSQIFINNEKLKLIHLKEFKSLTGKCLLHLNRNVEEEIVLKDIYNLQKIYLINSLPTFLRLRTLEFYDFNIQNCDHIAECINSCQKLKRLAISHLQPYSKRNLMDSVHWLKNLEMLTVNLTQVDAVAKEFIDYISYTMTELRFEWLYLDN